MTKSTRQPSTKSSQPSKESVKGGGMVVGAASLWALDGVLRRSLYSMAPLVIVVCEHFLGLLVLLGWGYTKLLSPKEGFSKEKVAQAKASARLLMRDKRTQTLAATIGLLSGLLGTVLITSALQAVNYIPFSVVLLLQKLQPLFAGVSAMILLKEWPAKQYWWWAGASLVAAFFVTFPMGSVQASMSSATVMAALMSLGAAACWGVGTTLSKMLLTCTNNSYASSVLRFSWTLVWGALALTLVAVVGTVALIFPSPAQWLTILAISLSTGAAAMVLYYGGLRLVSVMTSTILELTFPVLAVLIDVVVYHSVLHWSQYAAAVAMVFCLIQVAKLPVNTKSVAVSSD